MKHIKLFENYKNEDILYRLTKEARDILNDRESLGGSFADYCDIGVDILSELLEDESIEYYTINGFRYHKYEDSDGEYYGHWWIMVINGKDDDIILDPTIEQFDSTKYVITSKDDMYFDYHEEMP